MFINRQAHRWTDPTTVTVAAHVNKQSGYIPILPVVPLQEQLYHIECLQVNVRSSSGTDHFICSRVKEFHLHMQLTHST